MLLVSMDVSHPRSAWYLYPHHTVGHGLGSSRKKALAVGKVDVTFYCWKNTKSSESQGLTSGGIKPLKEASMYQVRPDWGGRYTAKEAERQLKNFEFKGPGAYLTETDTLIVVPVEVTNSPWQQCWPEAAVFEFNVYNCQFYETIFAVIGSLPSRLDTRE